MIGFMNFFNGMNSATYQQDVPAIIGPNVAGKRTTVIPLIPIVQGKSPP
jgi:hypothetical protein